MKIKYTNFFLAAFCAALTTAFAFFSFSITSAQTNNNRSTKTPTPTPSVRTAPTVNVQPTVEPTASPTPDPLNDNEVIRIETEEVNLNVRVVDRNNRPINGLRQNEFKVYENNVLQEISAFTTAEVPTNYALVIDNSGSLRSQLEKVIEAGKIIVNTNRNDDDTSVIRFVSSEKIEIVQDFTSNKSDLNEALDNLFIEGGPTAIIDAVYLAAERVDTHERSRNDRKRRALILVSDGEDRDSFYKEPQLFARLREADVQIYTIGFTSELEKEGGFISKSPRAKAENLMKRLAEETGGKAYFPKSVNELNDIARDIAAELRTQYLISYSPNGEKGDGSFRPIKVVVDEGPDKQKRIAITRTGRTNTTPAGSPNVPALQNRTKVQ